MSPAIRRVLLVPLTVVVIAAAIALLAPVAMDRYRAYDARFGPAAVGCLPTQVPIFGAPPVIPTGCPDVAASHHRAFTDLMVDAAGRSLALLIGSALIAAALGTMLGLTVALLRRRAFASGGIVGVLSLLAAIPSFFAAYFLQMAVIVFGAREGGNVLPVFGFGYDSHLVLPLLALSIPAVAYTAQLVSTRVQDVLASDFVTTATAKGLLDSWILRVHVLPHARPVVFEALGSGLRVSVASLPIVEYLFNWNGVGQIAIEAIALRDSPALVVCAVVLVSVFAVLSTIADLTRPRALYRRV